MNINVSVLVVSDRSFSGEREDLSGPAIGEAIQKLGWTLLGIKILPDSYDQIKNFLIIESSSGKVDLILTTGGTGFSPRDVTPEATLAVIEKKAAGLVEKIRYESSRNNPHAILSRAEAGILRQCLIINLPGNPDGAVESLSLIVPVLPHALSLIKNNADRDNHSVRKEY